jgi:hypothetical protein
MPKLYDKTDFYWPVKGDLVVGPDGDIFDTGTDPLRALVQEIYTRLRADQGDWELYPDVGANLSELIGEPNNQITAEAGKARIISALTRDGLVHAGDISLKYMPLGIDSVVYRLVINVLPTDENYDVDSLNINVLYDYTDGNLHFI